MNGLKSEEKKLTHLDENGMPTMVDVSFKTESVRIATAAASVYMSQNAFELAITGEGKKGDVFSTAKIAGIMAAKKTSELIPLCHPLNIENCDIIFEPVKSQNCINIKSIVKISGKTGVEMESLTAVSVAALTIYDMLKAVDKSIRITDIYLLRKEGGKSGIYECAKK